MLGLRKSEVRQSAEAFGASREKVGVRIGVQSPSKWGTAFCLPECPDAARSTAIRQAKFADTPFKSGTDCSCSSIPVDRIWRWRYRVDGKEKLMVLGEYQPARMHELLRKHEGFVPAET